MVVEKNQKKKIKFCDTEKLAHLLLEPLVKFSRGKPHSFFYKGSTG